MFVDGTTLDGITVGGTRVAGTSVDGMRGITDGGGIGGTGVMIGG